MKILNQDLLQKIIERVSGKLTKFRPFFELKVARLSESDLQDCMAYFQRTAKHQKIDIEALPDLIEKELKKEISKEKKQRLSKLIKELGNR